MVFNCNHDSFQKALQLVSRAVATKTTLPSLSGVLFEVSPGRVKLTATDLEIGVETFVPLEENNETARFVLPGKTITDLVRKLSGTIQVELSGDRRQVKIKSGRSVFNLNTLPGDDFPSVSPAGDGFSYEIRESQLKEAIRKTGFATVPEDSRAFLCSILLELDQTGFRAVATDVSRLALWNGELLHQVEEKNSLMIPARAMQELARILESDSNEPVTVTHADRRVFFRFRDIVLFTRLVQGQFPQYEPIIPKTASTEAIVDRYELMAALDRVALFVGSIKMAFSGNSVVLTGSGPDVGEAYEEVEATNEGPDMEVGFNAKFVLDFLKVCDGEEIKVRLNGPKSPVRFEALDHEGYIYILMPVIMGGD